MAFAATALKDMLSVSIKPRHDSQSDQFNRIFMLKFMLVASVITGVSWYSDSITCIVPESHGLKGGFVSSTCWIQGVYVYKELKDRVDEVAYYGIPKDIDYDGYLKNTPKKELCMLNPKLKSSRKPLKKNPACVPMEKTFFLQFQYMPFLIAGLSILFFLPYIFFKTVNSDLISLKDHVKSDEPNAGQIAKHFFDNKSNPQRNNWFRVLLNILIKIFYILSNVITLITLDNLLNGEFLGYGSSWISWSRLPNTIAYDYMGDRDHPKPANHLLPPFGYCEVYSSSKDIKESVANKHKYVCELSQYVLYQYVFMLIWFALICGIVVSVIGFILLLVHYLVGVFGLKAHGPAGRRIFKLLSFREIEYLEYIRKKDLGLYGEVLDKLRESRFGATTPPKNDHHYPPPAVDSAPLYPGEEKYTKKADFDF